MRNSNWFRGVLFCGLLLVFTQTRAHESTNLQIDVTGSSESSTGILTPTKILQGNELLDKLGTTLGATIGNELGVSQTGYGLGASRPVMRGLEGARVQILQNGLSVGDVSSISADHAVASPVANARQIEILRGAAALLYGSGSSGGLVNIVNDRILTSLPDEATGSANTSYDSVSNGRAASGHVDTSFESIAIHVDTAINNNQNYRIPGNSTQGGPNQVWGVPPGGPFENYTGKLPNSFNNQNNLGVGASYIGKSGYTGISVERMNNNYGIPTPEGGMIAQSQNRYDFQHQTRDPFAGFSSIKFSAANSNYNHTEFSITNGAYTPAALWKNIANEARLELAHKAMMGWKGTFGAQFTANSFEANEIGGGYAILPATKTNSKSLFWIEEGRWGALQGNLGLRYDSVKQNPNSATVFQDPGFTLDGVATNAPQTPSLASKNFNLLSYSAGGLWSFASGYGTGLSYTVSQRAPSAQELYSYGIHESTATFAVGNSNLSKETSHNLELNLQKTMGQVRGKVNVYLNKFSNYIYGYYTGVSENGEDFSVVQAQQAAATIKGAEGELTYNWGNVGSGARLFADASQGTFDAGGNLPLQPAPRVGLQVAHQKNGWLANASYTYSFQQNRLATWEVGPTPSYNLLNAGLSYTEKINKVSWTGYMMLKNILNDDIRYATTPMAVRLYAPQPGRSLMVGVRANF